MPLHEKARSMHRAFICLRRAGRCGLPCRAQGLKRPIATPYFSLQLFPDADKMSCRFCRDIPLTCRAISRMRAVRAWLAVAVPWAGRRRRQAARWASVRGGWVRIKRVCLSVMPPIHKRICNRLGPAAMLLRAMTASPGAGRDHAMRHTTG